MDSESPVFGTTPPGFRPADVIVRLLRICGTGRLKMADLATDFCVGFPAPDAARPGFAVTADLSLCRTIGLDGSPRVAMEAMREAGVGVRS